jgi:hypothetical protein
VELDGTVARLNRLEAASDDIGRRVRRAMSAIREVLVNAQVPGPGPGS